MWEPYEPPGQPEQKADRGTDRTDRTDWTSRPSPVSPYPPLSPDEFTNAPIRAGGQSSSGAGIAIGLVGLLAAMGIGVGVTTSAQPDPEPIESDWHSCIEQQEAEQEGSLLSPAEWCELNGYEAPADYVDDYDPFEEDGLDDGNGFLDDDY